MNKLGNLAILGFSAVLSCWAQCSNTSYGNGFNCVQAAGVANAGAGSTANATLPSNAAAGHQVVVIGFACSDSNCSQSAAGITLSATATGSGNSPVACPGNPYRLNSNIEIYGCWLMDVSAPTKSFTVTAIGGTPFYLSNYVSEWTGIAPALSAFDVGGTSFSAPSTTSASTATGTTRNAKDLIMGMLQLSVSTGVTPGTGFIESGEYITGIQQEGKSVASAGPQSCTWTFSSSPWQGLCFALKAAGGSTAPPTLLLIGSGQ